MKRITILAIIVFLAFNQAIAQTKHENTAWLFMLNSTKLSEKWGLHLDVQVRSNDDWQAVRNVLVRPGITYFIDKKQNVTAGYLLASTDNGVKTTYEQRI
ncbi:MAG: DUF2490 domain-containing protein, partial [Chitinophagaceae bacterium]